MRIVLNVFEGRTPGAHSRSISTTRSSSAAPSRPISVLGRMIATSRGCIFWSRLTPLLRLVDLGSRNGTYVNGIRVELADLHHRDRIKVGRTVLEVGIDSDLEAEVLVPTQPARTEEELAARLEEEWRAGRHLRIED